MKMTLHHTITTTPHRNKLNASISAVTYRISTKLIAFMVPLEHKTTVKVTFVQTTLVLATNVLHYQILKILTPFEQKFNIGYSGHSGPSLTEYNCPVTLV